MTLITKKVVYSSIYKVKRMYKLVQVTLIRFKITLVIYDDNHAGIGGICDVYIPG